MEIVLLERIENLGAMGEVVTVRPGYARNYLLPQKKALRATKENIARFEREREALEKLNDERRTEAETAGQGLDGASFVLIRQAGDTGQLYGSVTSRDIADAASESGASVSRGQVRLDTPIKTIGVYEIRIRLHPEVHVTVTVNVARSQDEADRQAEGEDVIASALEEDRAAAIAERTQLSEEQARELFEEGAAPEELSEEEVEAAKAAEGEDAAQADAAGGEDAGDALAAESAPEAGEDDDTTNA
jgi:large subunit ribosomal protein L9